MQLLLRLCAAADDDDDNGNDDDDDNDDHDGTELSMCKLAAAVTFRQYKAQHINIITKFHLPSSACHHLWLSRMKQVQDLEDQLRWKPVPSTLSTDTSTEIYHNTITATQALKIKQSHTLKN